MEEKGVRIVATIGLEIEVYGKIEGLMRAGKTEDARREAMDIVQDIIECKCTDNMQIVDIELSLQD